VHRQRKRPGKSLWLSLLTAPLIVLTTGLLAPAGAAAATPTAKAAAASADTAAGPSSLLNDFTDWSMGGDNIFNTRSNLFETTITAQNANHLAVKWTVTTHGDVSATPAVVDGALYFPDWGGYLDKVDASTGKMIWSYPISDYDGVAGAISRSSPAVADGVVYIGDRNGSNLIAVNAGTGKLLWIRQLDNQASAILTQSPIVYDGVVYEGVSSQEEAFATSPTYACCTFRGSITATNAYTGAPLWKTYTIPPNGGVPGGYNGGSVWGGTPAIDPKLGLVYITTGNNYLDPQSVTDCENAGGTAPDCLSPGDHLDSIIALNLHTGAIVWANGAFNFDPWNLACLTGTAPNNCPSDPGGDYDFSDGPHLMTIAGPNGLPEEVVGGGSKSGMFWTMNAATGKLLWGADVGPGSYSGGIVWGSSYDGKRIYVAEADDLKLPYQLPNGTTITSGSFAALDPATGKILWQVADPAGSIDWAPVTSAAGVVYACNLNGNMYALNATNGAQLFTYQGPYSCNAGAAVAGSTVYWGNGYANLANGSLTTGTFYAFSLDGR
jgi:polyvinyl alcohol dehydrogenase (cytochrome)